MGVPMTLACVSLVSAIGHANVATATDANDVILAGHDVVAYFTEGGPVTGSRTHSVMWNGATWHFANAANLAALILYLIFVPFAPFIFWALNGFLLGREYFHFVARRFLGESEATFLRKTRANAKSCASPADRLRSPDKIVSNPCGNLDTNPLNSTKSIILFILIHFLFSSL